MARQLLYLNHARTSWPKAPEVLAALARHVGSLAIEDPRTVDELHSGVPAARDAVAEFVGTADASRIVFTGSSTEALNLALKGFLHDGDHVVTTVFDHHATTRALTRLAAERRVEITRVAPGANGVVDTSALAAELRQSTRLLVVTHASNVTGALFDLEAVGGMARSRGVPVLVDAAATAGLVPLRVEADGIAMLAFGAHKRLLGPGGIGALYVQSDIGLEPLRDGNVSAHEADDHQPTVRPASLESGTANLLGIAALEAAVERVRSRGWAAVDEHLRPLTARLVDGLRGIAGVEVFAPTGDAQQIAIVSMRVKGKSPTEAQRRLRDDHGILVSAGLHNCPGLHRHLGTFPDGVVRMSPGEPTTVDDIDRALAAVAAIATH